MCGRYTLRTPWQRLAAHFGLRVTDLPELGGHRAAIPKWRFIPSSSKDGRIDATAETKAEKRFL